VGFLGKVNTSKGIYKKTMKENSLSIGAEFIRWLKEENVYTEFKNNFLAVPTNKHGDVLLTSGIIRKATFAEFIEEMSPHEYIGNAFLWNKTPEGFIFWSRVNSRWNNRIYLKKST
jgi:hypothetical protein